MGYPALKQQMKELKEQMKKEAQSFFAQEVKGLFDNNPELESFAWVQYTPYFNDGEACVFSARTDEPYVNSVDWWGNTLDGDDISDELYTYTGNYNRVWTEKGQRWQVLNDKVKSFIQNFDNEDLLDMFGDHCQVIVSREGIEITEYNHD